MSPFDPLDFFNLSFDDQVFRVALLALEGLTGLAFLFIVVAVGLRLQNDRKLAQRQRLDRQWQPLLFEVMAGERAPDSLQALIKPRHRFYFTSFLYRFARRVRGEDLERLREVARPFLPGVRAGLDDPLPEVRARRLQFLGLLGHPHYTEALLAALDDPSPIVAIVALRHLVRPEHAVHLPAVLARLHRFEHFNHQTLAALLAGVGYGALPSLRATLSDAGHPAWVRAVAAEALAELDDVHAAGLAAATLGTATEPVLLVAALRLLGRVGDDRHRAPIRALLHAPDDEVRMEAVRALGLLGDADDRPLLRQALDDPSPWVAYEAARSLKRIGDTPTLRALAASEHPRSRLLQQVLVEASFAS